MKQKQTAEAGKKEEEEARAANKNAVKTTAAQGAHRLCKKRVVERTTRKQNVQTGENESQENSREEQRAKIPNVKPCCFCITFI
jgi:hypothetical protein